MMNHEPEIGKTKSRSVFIIHNSSLPRKGRKGIPRLYFKTGNKKGF